MDHVERFYATIERNRVDRLACWLGIPVTAAKQGLFDHFKVKDIESLKRKIDDDVWDVEVPYHHPPSNHVACAFDFAKSGTMGYENRTLTAPGFFEDMDDPAKVDEFDWPDPAEHINPDECKEVVENVPDGYPVLGIIWSAHFQDVYSAFGMARAIIKMYKNPAMVHAVSGRIVEFYLKVNKIFFDATKGRLDAVLVGNDFGGQTRLMLSPANIKKFALPGSKKIIDQAKKYGLKVFYHSCGSVFEAIPSLIDLGIDVLHPIQALATDMEPEKLQEHYRGQLSFCGGVDAQQLLVNGSQEDVTAKVRHLKRVFTTGLIISPSHEAILPDIPPRNVEALFAAVK